MKRNIRVRLIASLGVLTLLASACGAEADEAGAESGVTVTISNPNLAPLTILVNNGPRLDVEDGSDDSTTWRDIDEASRAQFTRSNHLLVEHKHLGSRHIINVELPPSMRPPEESLVLSLSYNEGNPDASRWELKVDGRVELDGGVDPA